MAFLVRVPTVKPHHRLISVVRHGFVAILEGTFSVVNETCRVALTIAVIIISLPMHCWSSIYLDLRLVRAWICSYVGAYMAFDNPIAVCIDVVKRG